MAKRVSYLSWRWRFVCVSLALFAVIDACATATATQRIGNSEYRFSAVAPAGSVTCMEGDAGHLHGFSFLLAPNKEGCRSRMPQPYVGLFGDYNVAYAKTPAEWVGNLCPLKHSGLAPGETSGLAFASSDSVACETPDKDGWINVFVVTMADRWPDEKENPTLPRVPYFLYTAELHTNRIRRKRDLATLREILSTVKIEPQ